MPEKDFEEAIMMGVESAILSAVTQDVCKGLLVLFEWYLPPFA